MNLHLLVMAEFLKVCSRPFAKLGWLFGLALGLGMPLYTLALINSGIEVNGANALEFFGSDAPTDLASALGWRCFPLGGRAFLVILGAQMLAGEFASKTLREDMLRPNPRAMPLLAKFFALMGWDAIALAICFAGGVLIGCITHGFDGPWLTILLAYFLAWLADATVIGITLAVGIITRSTVGTVGGLIAFFALDKMLGWAMLIGSGAVRAFGGSETLATIVNQWPLLPSGAAGFWWYVLPETGTYGQLWAAMLPEGPVLMMSMLAGVVYTGLALLFGVIAIQRIDVP